MILFVSILALGGLAYIYAWHQAQPADTERTFANSSPIEERGFMDVLKWKWQTRNRQDKDVHFELAENDPAFLRANGDQPTLTWIGHSSFLIQYDGFNILTDPHMTDRASPFSWAGPKRAVPPGLKIDELPEIDLILLSHNHYDHLDLPTLEAIKARQHEAPMIFAPEGMAGWLKRQGYPAKELAWWDTDDFSGWKLSSVPGQHFSGRWLTDRNETHWCGWVMQHQSTGFSLYFVGDTGYSDDFKKIGSRFESFDLSLIPIGAYEPRWFMKPVHVNPEEAVQIHRDVASRFSIGMHWGTFKLTDEPLDEPPRKLKQALRAAGIADSTFITLQHGQTIHLDDYDHIARESR